MVAKDLISDLIPFLRNTDTGKKALTWMEIFRISHLPIVHNEEFLGLISDNDIYDLNMVDETIGNHSLSLFRPYVLSNQHIFEVIEVVARLKLSVIPVLNPAKKYLGIITLYDLLQQVATLTAVQNPGGIIVLEMNIHDYSLSEISQIVEGNNAKILSLYIDNSAENLTINVTIKLNRMELAPILQTFERYGYTIKETFAGSEEETEIFQERYEEFIRYLNV